MLLLFRVHAFSFCLLAAYRGIKILQWDPSSSIPAQCYLRLIFDGFHGWKTRLDQLHGLYNFSFVNQDQAYQCICM